MDKCDKFDFNTLPDYTPSLSYPALALKYMDENRKLKARIKELEERILSLELDLSKADEEIEELWRK